MIGRLAGTMVIFSHYSSFNDFYVLAVGNLL